MLEGRGQRNPLAARRGVWSLEIVNANGVRHISPAIALPHRLVSRPFGTYPMTRLDPTLKRWAILTCPSGTGHEYVPSGLDGTYDLSRHDARGPSIPHTCHLCFSRNRRRPQRALNPSRPAQPGGLADGSRWSFGGPGANDHRETVERKRTPEGVPGPAVCSEPT